MSVLECERVDYVAVVTLNRPEVRNALSMELLGELRGRIAELDADSDVRAIVLTGADPSFCAGVDLRELERGIDDPNTFGPGTAPFVSRSTPVIGAINGAAFTGGLELALTCHFLIASERATFADTHAKLGVMPGWGMSVLLSDAIGTRHALQMSLTCEPIDASTALTWGLVNQVVPHEDLMNTATTMAQTMAALDNKTLQRHVRLYSDQMAERNKLGWVLEGEAWSGVQTLRVSKG
jgi:enoyl-CoA hydratase